ncbi:MAG: CaiB/BaiF CoA transferase family protein [Candidatus Kariarchaeaceae archaeon]|jgi:crotonobetainyl-CoA:carnitine CoA-transferase CaiB-like acyl-CoA transferase
MSGLLSGLKILDFSTLLPGPYASMILSDMGAEVIHIESIDRSDLVRELPPLINEVSAVHEYINRNKRSMAIDLKKPQAREIITELIQEYDIVIEQFRPGVMKRLGLDYSSLKKLNPKIIYGSLTAYGQKGPYSTKAGHDINFMALSGIASYNGTKELGPGIIGLQVGDLSGSLYMAIGLLGAVIHRMKTGKGQYLDISMCNTLYSLSPIKNVEWLSGGQLSAYGDGMLNGSSYYGYYETKDKRYISIGSLEPKFFSRLAEGLSLPDLFIANPLESETIIEQIRGRIKEKTQEEWIEIFSGIDACVEPVLSQEEAHKHLKQQNPGLITEIKKNGETRRQVAHPITYSGFVPQYGFPGSRLGEHTSEILKQIGISEVEETMLRNSSVVS